MAIGQLASIGSMPRILSAYGLVGGAAAAVLAVGLIAGELVCGARRAHALRTGRGARSGAREHDSGETKAESR